MMRIVKKHVAKQPDSGDSAKERSINWFQPVLFSAVFHEIFKNLISSLNQLSAVINIVTLTRIDLTYRRVFYICWYAQKLTE